MHKHLHHHPPSLFHLHLLDLKEKLGAKDLLLAMNYQLICFLGEIFVDNTDLIIFKPTYLSIVDLWDDLQKSVTGWGKLLLSMGGALNPAKCSWYAVDYECCDGTWTYEQPPDWNLYDPLPDCSQAAIPQVPANVASKISACGCARLV
jgi:hypothetical protein